MSNGLPDVRNCLICSNTFDKNLYSVSMVFLSSASFMVEAGCLWSVNEGSALLPSFLPWKSLHLSAQKIDSKMDIILIFGHKNLHTMYKSRDRKQPSVNSWDHLTYFVGSWRHICKYYWVIQFSFDISSVFEMSEMIFRTTYYKYLELWVLQSSAKIRK